MTSGAQTVCSVVVWVLLGTHVASGRIPLCALTGKKKRTTPLCVVKYRVRHCTTGSVSFGFFSHTENTRCELSRVGPCLGEQRTKTTSSAGMEAALSVLGELGGHELRGFAGQTEHPE